MTIPGLQWLGLKVPGATTKAVTHRFHHTRQEPVAGAIIHSMGEYIVNTDARVGPIGRFHAAAWIDAKNLSVHAYVTPDGSILMGVPSNRVALHAGKSAWKGKEWLNATFLGCEFLVKGDHDYGTFLGAIKTDIYTDAQYTVGGMLFAGWAKEYGFGKDMIVRHSDVSGDEVRGAGQGKVDPGQGFSDERFWDAFDKAGA